jgi:hypothetical protein
MSRLLVFPVLFIALLCLVSCSASGNFSSNSGSGTPADVPITMSVQDTPPAGVTVLSFEIQITSAILQPMNAANPVVTLLARPTDVELEHLQSEPALLGGLNVPAGTYTGVTVAFTNPRMVIFNSTAAAINVGTTVCAAKALCKLTPTLASATTTVNTAPFPITLTSKSPLGLLLHFDVNSSVSSDLLTITPTVDLKEITPSATGVIHQEHLVGTITNVSSPNFTIQPGVGAPIPVAVTTAPTFLIKTDNNTKYTFVDDLHSQCPASNFTCLAVGQTVNVTVNVMSDSSLLATEVSLFEQQNAPAFEGLVTTVDPAHNQFTMALLGGQFSPTAAPTTASAIAVGVLVTITVTPGTVYEIDTDGFTLPAGLTFSGIADMVAGQTVEIQPQSVILDPSTSALALITPRVRLDETQVTAKVASIDNSVTRPTAFTLGNNTLPPLFSATPSLKVQTITTPPPTLFQNVNEVSGLSIGDTVSVGGLLFNTPTTPTLAAEKVLKRIPCSATAAGSTTTIACVM